jgi:hypothetical protein
MQLYKVTLNVKEKSSRIQYAYSQRIDACSSKTMSAAILVYLPNTANVERICIMNDLLKFFVWAIETEFLQAVAQSIIRDLPQMLQSIGQLVIHPIPPEIVSRNKSWASMITSP